MVNYIHADFTNSREAYEQATAFWASEFDRLVGTVARETESYVAADPFREGNPMFNRASKRLQRAFRVIQEPPSGHPGLSGWLDKLDDCCYAPYEDADELVLVVELTEEVWPTVERLIRAWFVEQVSREAMEKLLGEVSPVPAA